MNAAEITAIGLMHAVLDSMADLTDDADAQ